ncbi:MAG: cupredoxin domain-containing protein [Acidimicrobiales bacterium]
MTRLFRTSAFVVIALIGAACTTDDTASAIEVISTNTACNAAKTELEAGKLTFKVVNKGDKATELYVLDGDRVINEVENVGPGTSRTMTVDLPAGTYDLGCKPGQSGPFIREAITITGQGGEEQSTKYDREIEFHATDFAFDLAATDLKKGERIEFKMENDGTVEHEFELFAPDGEELGEILPTQPGATGEMIVALADAGTYTFKCGIEDHAARGQEGTFTVS